MYNFCFWCKFIQISCNTVVKSCSDRKKHITFADCHICCVFSMHTAVSYIERMARRDRTFPHDRCDHRDLHLLRQCEQFVIRMCDIDTSSGKDQRFLCGAEQFIRFFQLSDMYRLIRLITADLDVRRILRRSCCRLDILRNIDQYRSRLAGGCDIKCHLDDTSQIFPSAHGHTVFCDTSCHSDNIYFLECIISY